MQFLPSTWATFGHAAAGPGPGNPDDIDDATLAAAHFLCAAGGDLSTGDGWQTAVLAYNHSRGYLTDVAAAAQIYADRSLG